MEVDRYAESYKAAIDEHRAALRREVNQVRNNKLTTLHTHHDDLRARSEHTAHAVTFGQELLAESSDIEVLNNNFHRTLWVIYGQLIFIFYFCIYLYIVKSLTWCKVVCLQVLIYGNLNSTVIVRISLGSK